MKSRVIACMVLLVLANGACAATNAPPYPWEMATDTETMCLFSTPPSASSLTPPAVRTMLGDRIPVRMPVRLKGAYAAYALLADGTYCLAVWTDAVVTGQPAWFTLDARGTYSTRVIVQGAESGPPCGPDGGKRLPLGRKPLFIQCNRCPDQWVTPALVWAALPYELGARVMLNKGTILVGITNYLDRPIGGTVRIVAGNGVRLLANTIGFTLPARSVMLEHLPVREATMDEPFITSMVVLDSINPRHVRLLRTQCRSGALFRNPELGTIVGPLPPQARVGFLSVLSGELAMLVDNYPIVRNVRFAFPGTEVAWAGAGVGSTGFAAVADVRVAALTRLFRHNGRGDCQAFVGYDMKDNGPAATDAPQLICDLAWAAISNGLVFAKAKGNYRCGLLDADHIAGTLARVTGQEVEEWSVALERDWLTINLENAWVQVGRAGTAPDADIRLTIRSRAPWTSPAPSGRAGNIQFFVHLPVAR